MIDYGPVLPALVLEPFPIESRTATPLSGTLSLVGPFYGFIYSSKIIYKPLGYELYIRIEVSNVNIDR